MRPGGRAGIAGCVMADGWLFRLRSTLGAQHAVPAWPASHHAGGEPWPALRVPETEVAPEPTGAGKAASDDVSPGPKGER